MFITYQRGVAIVDDRCYHMLRQLAGTEALFAALLCGSGLRLRESLGSRVKDVDFDRHAIIVRSSKGDKDRVEMIDSIMRRTRAVAASSMATSNVSSTL